MSLKFYNSLSKKIELFQPIDASLIKVYCCGPTVYNYVSIGNWRTYVLGDILARALLFNDFKIKYVMNITDVGHMSKDSEQGGDLGLDKVEVAAEKEGKSAKDITDFYTQDFLKNYEKLNLTKVFKFTRATDYIKEQINLVKILQDKGYTYATREGIYYDTSKFKNYGELSGLSQENVKEGARVEINFEKKNPTDFSLWRLSPKDSMRWQEWDSPWGRGFPGWHLECSAMIESELGSSIDFHIGGEDLKMIHHQNEIAQSESANNKFLASYWIHGAFLQIDGGRMGKSLGNFYTIDDIEQKGFSFLSLRYFYLSAHYRSKLNFTWEALQNSQNSLKKLYDVISSYQEKTGAEPSKEFIDKFKQDINEDLNMPKAVATTWELVKSSISEDVKIATLLVFDKVLGLNLSAFIGHDISTEVLNLAKVRWEYKRSGIWDKADALRREIENMGFIIEDEGNDYKIKRRILY